VNEQKCLTSDEMPSEHLVVDGSNIATEGRSAPSLRQLEEAVSELRREYPDAEVTVIVDATFSHRIDPSELEQFEKAALEGEYVHPPAGAIGRGDAFLLRIAEKVDAIVLSNDSFQEFHGEHPWLFERGRLLGATPVPGVGWIFSPRTPVRGPKSHRAVRDTDRAKKQVSKAIEAATKEAVSPPSAAGGRAPAAAKRVAKKKEAEGTAPAAPRTSSRRPSTPSPPALAVNDPLTFISFIAEHALGTEVVGCVDSYTSHGAVVFVGGVQCYVPLANMAAPAPRSAREALKRNEERTFVVTALDPLRRGVELALPGIAVVSGRPSEEMIAAELRLAKRAAAPAKKAAAPVKKAVAATKKSTPPAKKSTPPAKKGTAPAKKSTPPAKKSTAPAKKSTALAGHAAPPARQAAAPPKKAGPAAKKAATAAPPPKKVPASVKKSIPPAKKSAVPTKEAATAKKASAPGPLSGRRSGRARSSR
jgi:hypothetical protein